LAVDAAFEDEIEPESIDETIRRLLFLVERAPFADPPKAAE
jgi:hypothetical protein